MDGVKIDFGNSAIAIHYRRFGVLENQIKEKTLIAV